MNNINNQKFYIIAKLRNTLTGTSRMIEEDRKMLPIEKEEVLSFIKGLEEYIKKYEPNLTKNEPFFEKSEDDGSR